MGLKKVIKKGLFSGIKPSEWIGSEQIKEGGSTIKQLLKANKGKQQRWDSFEKFMYDNNLSDADIEKMARLQTRVSYGCLVASLFLLYYMFHLFAAGLLIGGLLAFMLTLYAISQAYAASIRSFKLKRRILSTTFSTWFHSLFQRKVS
ncbi:MAG: hypothetical protein K0U12_00915 [Gammaproteobacteria bacterium]|nr:hypothetical protein [Gammaproteobacteria bacterium]